ncbi:MAG: conserved membrane protein of unknown function [Nitrospira sp.]|nr:MAG: conserved membrane protein of unknown function [Nitrospira sp.]
MSNQVSSLIDLYRQAGAATVRSLRHGWVAMIALVGFALLFVGVSQFAGSLGIVGGFLLGALNALLVGATLSLIEQSLSGTRSLHLQDIQDSLGSYFWEVIGVGFVLWLPIMALDMGTQANPYGQFLSSAVLLLLFILLNPAPEVIYQVRQDSPLEVLKTCYEFVLENWIEWFVPFGLLILPVALSPSGFEQFIRLSSRLGRGAGLDFFQLLILPFTILGGWFAYLGIPADAYWVLAILLTPPVAMSILLFRGHLFALLHRSSRRQREFARRFDSGR